MHGRWWRWLGTVLAVVSGLVFGWVAGSGLVHAAPVGMSHAVRYPPAQCAAAGNVFARPPKAACPATLGQAT